MFCYMPLMVRDSAQGASIGRATPGRTTFAVVRDRVGQGNQQRCDYCDMRLHRLSVSRLPADLHHRHQRDVSVRTGRLGRAAGCAFKHQYPLSEVAQRELIRAVPWADRSSLDDEWRRRSDLAANIRQNTPTVIFERSEHAVSSSIMYVRWPSKLRSVYEPL